MTWFFAELLWRVPSWQILEWRRPFHHSFSSKQLRFLWWDGCPLKKFSVIDACDLSFWRHPSSTYPFCRKKSGQRNNQSSSLVRLRCYLQVSSFRLQTGNWYSRWRFCFNSTFNFRCSCSAPCVVFNSVATVLLPVCCLGVKPGSPIFSHFVVHQYQLLINFCQEAVPLQKGCQFRNCSLQNELWNKPNHAAFWSNLRQRITTNIFVTNIMVTTNCPVTSHRVTIFLKIFYVVVVSHFQFLTALAFCR